MKKYLISLIFLLIVVFIILLVMYGPACPDYWFMKTQFFDKSALPNAISAADFDINKMPVKAYYYSPIPCGDFTIHKILKDGKWKKVSSEEFYHFIKNAQDKCNNCLIEYVSFNRYHIGDRTQGFILLSFDSILQKKTSICGKGIFPMWFPPGPNLSTTCSMNLTE